jgi:tetratricopeptide (TPR) repeat protein
MAGDADDVLNLIHRARAAALMSQGSLAEAERHARQALAHIADWDMPNDKGATLVQLADVLCAAGRADEAIPLYAQAVEVYARKENMVEAGRVERVLEALRAGATA